MGELYISFCLLTSLFWHFLNFVRTLITHFDVSRPQGSAAALDGPGARYGYGVSRIWTLRVLWPVSERPESGRLVCSGRVRGVQILDACPSQLLPKPINVPF